MKIYAVLEIVVDINGARKWSSRHEVDAETAAEAITTVTQTQTRLRPPMQPGDLLMLSATQTEDMESEMPEEFAEYVRNFPRPFRGDPNNPAEVAAHEELHKKWVRESEEHERSVRESLKDKP